MTKNDDLNINNKILIIDDNPDIHNDFDTILSPEDSSGHIDKLEDELFGEDTAKPEAACKYRIEHAMQGKEGLEKIEQSLRNGSPYALAFVDMRIQNVINIVDENSKESIDNPITKSLESDSVETGTDTAALMSRKGTICPASICATPLKNTDGSIIGSVAVIHDVSKERNLDHMKTDFVSSVSHELRTPLTSIKAFTATILRDPDMKEETKTEFLNIIDQESNRLADLIEDLLQMSRIEAGTYEMDEEPVSFEAVINQVLPALEPLASKKNIKLTADISADLPGLPGDASKIQSVATNLVNNAIKFTPDGGKVTVSALENNGEIIFSVKDTGMGIPEEDIEKIFDKFHRVNRPGTQIQGTGLGLAIVYKVVEAHNGKIEVESEVDKGTTFILHFPILEKATTS